MLINVGQRAKPVGRSCRIQSRVRLRELYSWDPAVDNNVSKFSEALLQEQMGDRIVHFLVSDHRFGEPHKAAFPWNAAQSPYPAPMTAQRNLPVVWLMAQHVVKPCSGEIRRRWKVRGLREGSRSDDVSHSPHTTSPSPPACLDLPAQSPPSGLAAHAAATQHKTCTQHHIAALWRVRAQGHGATPSPSTMSCQSLPPQSSQLPSANSSPQPTLPR